MEETKFYEIVKPSAADKKIVRVTYQDSQGRVTERRMEPYEIKGGYFFGWGIDPGSNGELGIKRMIIGRITKVEVTEETFIPRYPNMIL